jgi:hypothetical protein
MGRQVFDVDLSKVYTDQKKFHLGDWYQQQDAKFVFVKYNDGDGNVAGTAGLLCYQIGSATTGFERFEVTCDFNSATIVTLLQASIGILQATLADGQYGWAQYEGFGQKDITTDGNVTAGARLMAGGADGTVINHDAGAKLDIGVALEADPVSGATTTLAAGKYKLNIPI